MSDEKPSLRKHQEEKKNNLREEKEKQKAVCSKSLVWAEKKELLDV